MPLLYAASDANLMRIVAQNPIACADCAYKQRFSEAGHIFDWSEI